MRAKDYAYQFLQDPTDETLARIAADMLLEVPTIVRKRNIKLDRGFISVIKEQDQKWHCFARQVAKNGYPEVREDGFTMLVWSRYPDLFAAVWPDLSISEDLKVFAN